MGALSECFDVIIVGAGISGIDAGYRLQEQCPNKSYTILEARENLGGTWDLFKFPGIRSDSDLHTFGFPFRPWNKTNAIAEAPLILEYMKETAAEFGIDKHIQFSHYVQSADWSSEQQQWTLSVSTQGSQKIIKGQFLFLCTGYYDYKNPLTADIPGLSNFKGLVIHPQFWPEDLDYTDKKVTIIGSGATAVTIVPNMAKHTPHVTMLQRSPTYVVALPQDDAINRFFRRILPERFAYRAIRFRFIMLAYLSYTIFQKYPNMARKLLRKQASRLLPEGYEMSPNFDPKYNPWDQRLCISPKGDFYKAIKDGRAEIVTGSIETVTEDSIKIKDSDKVLNPDIIVTATGLKLQVAGGAKVTIDGVELKPSEKFVYRHAMLQDVPNAAIFVGYVNASWTLGADATAHWMCRLINSMDKSGAKSATPRVKEEMEKKPLLSLNSTYIKEGGAVLPNAGSRPGWTPRNMYFTDLWEAWRGNFKDLEFASGPNQPVENGKVEEKLKAEDQIRRDSGIPAEPVKVKGI